MWLTGKLHDDAFVFLDQAQDTHAQLTLTRRPGSGMQEIKQHFTARLHTLSCQVTRGRVDMSCTTSKGPI